MLDTPVYETAITEPGNGLKYRIQMRRVYGIWMQRHIWYPAKGTYVDKPTAEQWIRSVGTPPKHYIELTTQSQNEYDYEIRSSNGSFFEDSK